MFCYLMVTSTLGRLITISRYLWGKRNMRGFSSSRRLSVVLILFTAEIPNAVLLVRNNINY